MVFPTNKWEEEKNMRNMATDMAVEMKKVIASLTEKLDAGKYRAFSLQLELVIREYGDEFNAAGISNLSVLSDLYYMEGHDEQIKDLLSSMSNVLDTYIAHQDASDNLFATVSKITHSKNFIDHHELARSLGPTNNDDDDDELY